MQAIPILLTGKQPFVKGSEVRLVKAMVFPVVMYGYKSWAIKTAEGQIMDALDCAGEDS